MSLKIRKAGVEDASSILDLIRGIAEYENLTHQVEATEELIRQNMLGHTPYAHCKLAYWSGQLAGYAVYYFKLFHLSG